MKGKTKFLILMLVLLIVASAMIMVSCNKSKGNTGTTSSDTPSEVVVPGTDVNFTVYFYYLPTDTEPYAQITIKSGSKIKVADIPTNLTRDGYQFGGWYKNTSYSDEFNTNAVINKDIKLYALWIAFLTGTVRKTVAAIFTASPGRNGITHRESAAPRAFPVCSMNAAVPTPYRSTVPVIIIRAWNHQPVFSRCSPPTPERYAHGRYPTR